MRKDSSFEYIIDEIDEEFFFKEFFLLQEASEKAFNNTFKDLKEKVLETEEMV